jgi:hypothetical protein
VRDRRGSSPLKPQPGEFVRVGEAEAVILPNPRPARGQAVYLLFDGTATVLAMSGLVNGQASLSVNFVGLHIAVSTGEGWSVTRPADTATDTLDALGTTRGSVLYRGASAWTTLAPGTNGLPLASNGAGADPSYKALDSSGLDMTAGYVWTGAHSFNGNVAMNGSMRLNGVFSTTLAAQADNLNIGAATAVRITLTGAQNLSGMIPAGDGHMVFIINVDSADDLTILHNSGASSAGRQVLCPGAVNFVLQERTFVTAYADATLGFWFLGSR